MFMLLVLLLLRRLIIQQIDEAHTRCDACARVGKFMIGLPSPQLARTRPQHKVKQGSSMSRAGNRARAALLKAAFTKISTGCRL